MSSQTYLATVCIDGSTKSVSSPPLKECTFLIPSLSVDGDASDDFENVTILESGEVVFEPKFVNRTNTCLLTTVPVLYPSSVQSAMSGDMDLVLCESYVIGNSTIDVWKTKPYPSDPASVVLFSGSLNCFREVELLHLPRELTPSVDMMFPTNGGIIIVFHSGAVHFRPDEGFLGQFTISLDNIRFPINICGNTIRAGAPHRSHILMNGLIYPKLTDLYFPVVLADDTKSVVRATCHDNKQISTPILVSSIFVSDVPCQPTAVNQLIFDQMGSTALIDAVAQRLSALVFARLSGEAEQKCVRRDRGWRQTGVKNAPHQERKVV